MILFRKRLSPRFLCLLSLSSLLIIILVIIFHVPADDHSKFDHKTKVDDLNNDENHNEQPKKSLFNFDLLNNVTILNAHGRLLNEDKYLPLTDQDLIIVVQVHKRLEYLKNLIESLSKTKYINETLLVFSHDVFDKQINDLVQSIHFAKTLQIFLPFSIQIWTNTFPGTSKYDCPRNLNKNQALDLNCLNAYYPDTYGHYREAKVTQIKHHWWWKLHFIMDHSPFTKDHRGDVMFIEEDHYVSPDLIHLWKHMKALQSDLKSSGTTVDILTLGNYEKIVSFETNTDKLNLTDWFSGKHNMAFTINYALWNQIKSCRIQFCTYDDYNWDWSLQYIIKQCLKRRLLTLVSAIPRVYHTGTCGLHHKSRDCNARSQLEKMEKFFKTYQKYLFPNDVHIQKYSSSSPRRKVKNNGGWSDPRDHQLCIQYQFGVQHILKHNPNFKDFEINLSKLLSDF